ncbi:MAG: hypothetical protein QXL17_06450 [Candidatus Thermoplasmatota archaeon]
MPCGDGTGPWWAQEKKWTCWAQHHARHRWNNSSFTPPLSNFALSKEDYKKMLKEQLHQLERQQKTLKETIKSLEQDDTDQE